MKLLSFSIEGRNCFGAFVHGQIIDWTGLNKSDIDLKSTLDKGLDYLYKLEDAAKNRGKKYLIDDCQYLPVIPNPGKIICIGLNYEMHRKETQRKKVGYPTVFARYPDSQTGHMRSLIKPKKSDRFDFEGELAVVIGKEGRYIAESDALGVIAGFSIYNDGSVRDFQKHTHQFTPGKNFPSSGAFGPYLVTKDEIKNYRNFTIETRLNGEVMQKASLDDLIFSIPELITYCSEFSVLYPGDVIVTGTPGGVGDRRDPPVYLKHGDLVEVEVNGIGILANIVSDEK